MSSAHSRDLWKSDGWRLISESAHGSLNLSCGYFAGLDCIVGKTFPAASNIPVLIPWPINKYYYGEKAKWKPLELSLVENHKLWHLSRGTAEMNATTKDLRGAGW